MGPAKTLALLGPPQSRTYVQQQQHDAAGTDAFLAFPRIGCVKVCVRTEKRVKPNQKKKEKRGEVQKVVRPVKNEER